LFNFKSQQPFQEQEMSSVLKFLFEVISSVFSSKVEEIPSKKQTSCHYQTRFKEKDLKVIEQNLDKIYSKIRNHQKTD